jgi:hypothetical protein
MVSGPPAESQSAPTLKAFPIAKPLGRNMGARLLACQTHSKILMLAMSPENVAAPRYRTSAAALPPSLSPLHSTHIQTHTRTHPNPRPAFTATAVFKPPLPATAPGSLTYFRAGTSRIRAPDSQRAGASPPPPTSRRSEQRPHMPTRIKAHIRRRRARQRKTTLTPITQHTKSESEPRLARRRRVASWTWMWEARGTLACQRRKTGSDDG